VGRVGSGSRQIQSAGDTLAEMVTSVQRVSELVASVSTAAQAQSQGIGQINLALADLDQATQQNAALVEESAAAADSLRAQTHGLARSAQQFRLERTRV
jgi:methyl-accepting chemotaxis protein